MNNNVFPFYVESNLAAHLYIRYMPWHPRLSNQVFVSPTVLIGMAENGDEIEPDLSGGKAMVMMTHGKGEEAKLCV